VASVSFVVDSSLSRGKRDLRVGARQGFAVSARGFSLGLLLEAMPHLWDAPTAP